MARRVQFFTGKGGVGKSTVLAATALTLAHIGQSPLIVELGSFSSPSHLLHGPSIGYEPTGVAPGVYATRVAFEPALIDYVSERVKSRTIASLIAKNTSLRSVFSAAPGVDEIVTLHRVAELAMDDRWDLVLVDLESTGHALMFFDLPSVFDAFLGNGPLRRVMDQATCLLRDVNSCAIHVVTAPQPLIVRETIDLYRQLNARTDLHLGHLFINRVPHKWFADEEVKVVEVACRTHIATESWPADLWAAKYAAIRQVVAARCVRGLRRDISLPTFVLHAHTGDSAEVIDALSSQLTGIMQS